MWYAIEADRAPFKVTLGGHSALDPPLPIPNRVVKRSRADDSVHSHAKVGHCQAPYNKKSPARESRGFFYWRIRGVHSRRCKSCCKLITASEAKPNYTRV